MKNTTVKINGQVVALEYDYHYNNIYCVDVYVNDSFEKQDIDKKTAKLILEWIDSEFNKAIKNNVVICLAIYNSDGYGAHRIKLFERMGFIQQGPLYYREA